ncbi:hypothetical protein SALLE_v1c07950 [Spiroplasma alleghenense]|uniref:Uncharacterized protein n=1 Tax=Spiroplasma alleghenense TaxID=216931 RepID=A0A345Z4D6_9MOLU|nr:hypothetical protein SALLE_v1c07950 [Spiroplasma alleghenense]
MFINGTSANQGSYKMKNFTTTWDNSEKLKAENSSQNNYNNLLVF